jgi:hypothetical protein
LELEGYDIIFGCDWIFEFKPVGINLKTREFTIEKDGEKLIFKDETLSDAKFLVSHKKMKKMLTKGAVGAVIYVQKLQLTDPNRQHLTPLQDILDQFSDVFAEPAELPPPREVDHKIPL